MTIASSTASSDFSTPPRILVPKLVRSRDGWKLKATQRKAQRKALQIRVRDLTTSRRRRRDRAETLAAEVESLRLQLEHTRSQCDLLRSRVDTLEAAAPAKKKS